MSKDRKRNSQPVSTSVEEVVLTPDPVVEQAAVAPVGAAVPMPAATPRLMDVDRMALELAKQRRQTALAEAKTALAQNENAELAYKYVVLQIYMKYGLTDADAISENGEIVKNGALAPPAPPKTQ